jgi:hypothetical protein
MMRRFSGSFLRRDPAARRVVFGDIGRAGGLLLGRGDE